VSERAIEKRFVVAVPREQAWAAFTDQEQRRCWDAPDYEIDPRPGGKVRWRLEPWPGIEGEVVEADAPSRLRMTESSEVPGVMTDLTIRFESVDGGTRISITQAGFGDGPEWDAGFESHSRGWDMAIADLVLYLMDGTVARRFATPWRTTLGVAVLERPEGLRVVTVDPGGYADEVGLRAGDVVLRIGGVPIFWRTDLWCVQHAHSVGEPLAAEFARGGELLTGEARLRENVTTG
jgi:uncharacterized protein YndB with AHSA1/START domain